MVGATLFLAATLIAAVPASFAGAEIHVCPACAVKTIREGVAAAPAGGTVLVSSGTYFESEIAISKSVRVEAEPGATPTVDGGGRGSIFVITAPNVTIRGLTIRNCGQSYNEELAGVKILETTSCEIAENTFEADTYGIYLGGVHGCRIRANRIRGNAASESSGGDGIHLWHCGEIDLEGNSVSGQRDGIYFEFVEDSRIRRNESRRNLRYGLHFMYSNRDTYEANQFELNGSGVAVMFSHEIRMLGNRFAHSRGGAAYGILLKEISASEIRGNEFNGNTVGAFLEGTTRSVIAGNVFRGNGWALRALGNTESNSIVGNDFLDNTFDLSTNASRNPNTISGNYWSRYRGIDLNRDGVGDSPYFPVQLSTLLMEKYGASVLLARSFLFTVLDEAEAMLPALTPETFRDDAPRMRRATRL